MASKATPISQLQSAQSQFTNTNDTIVNDILQEIESTNNQSTIDDMGSKQVQYQMDPTTQQPHSVMSSQHQQQSQIQHQQQPPNEPHMIQHQQPPLTMHNDQFQENMPHYMNEAPVDTNGYHQFTQKPSQEQFSLEMILEETKLPLIVSLLVVVFNLKQLDSNVIKFIPKALGEDGNITTLGLLMKGLVAGVFFYLAKKFI
jgi:hypothetical protein